MSDNCSCSIRGYSGDDGMEEVYSGWSTSDYGVSCCECGDVVEKFRLEVGVNVHSPVAHSTCHDCYIIREALCCDGYEFGSLWSDIDEMFEEALLNGDDVTIPEAVLSELESSETRNILIEYMEQHWTALDVLYRCIDSFGDSEYFAFPEHELSQVTPSTREYLLKEIEKQWAAMEKKEYTCLPRTGV